MAKRRILNRKDDTLRKKCKPVEGFNERLAVLIDDLFETMYDASGVGLAAPQVGILRRVAVVDAGEGAVELVNPVIISRSDETERRIEGCLSCPEEWGYVSRPAEITAKYQDRNGNFIERSFSGYFARAVMHETDHLDGKLFIDIADEMVDPNDLEDE